MPVLRLHQADNHKHNIQSELHISQTGQTDHCSVQPVNRRATYCFCIRSVYAPLFRALRIMSQMWELSPGHLGSPYTPEEGRNTQCDNDESHSHDPPVLKKDGRSINKRLRQDAHRNDIFNTYNSVTLSKFHLLKKIVII